MMDLTCRQQLAAAFHIAVVHGWDQLVYNHFTCRSGSDRFLVHPFGLLFSEVTASSLLDVSLSSGDLCASPSLVATVVGDFALSPDMVYNKAAFVLHSSIYLARPDVVCVLHVHVPCIVAVASSRSGLIVGLSQESSLVGPVTYHDYEGIVVSPGEQLRLVANLGPVSNVLFLRNHGVVCCGRSVAHALSVLYHVWRACLVQVALGSAEHHVPAAGAVADAFETHATFSKTGNHNLEFAAMLRHLRRIDPEQRYLQ